MLKAYKYAIENNADYIFQTDSDGQTLPEEFHSFWEEREKYDMIIGQRSNRKDGFFRIFVTKVLKLVIRLCFGVDTADANTPFRLLKSETLKKYISLIPENYFLSNCLISVIYEKKNLSVKYVPITFLNRQKGVNSINIKKIFVIGKKAFKSFRQINKDIEKNQYL